VKRTLVVPYLVTVWVIGAAALLVGIVVFGPYTHDNLQPQVESSYTRTNQVAVGAPDLFGGMPGVSMPSGQIARGRTLFMSNECATCHGLQGQGSTIGPTLTGTSAADLRTKTMQGVGAMPPFDPAALSDEDLAAIAAYLSPR
jgi:mono/diheme cytochrome c family protein